MGAPNRPSQGNPILVTLDASEVTVDTPARTSIPLLLNPSIFPLHQITSMLGDIGLDYNQLKAGTMGADFGDRRFKLRFTPPGGSEQDINLGIPFGQQGVHPNSTIKVTDN